jgi:hypothetical protein
MIDLVSAFRAVVDALESAEIDYLVVGSTAAAAWGVARTTRDVDLVALMSASNVQDLVGRLDADSFYVPVDDALRAGRDSGSFNVLHTTSGGKVDVFVARHDDEFTRSRMERKVRSQVLGVQAWIATPEDVVLAKLKWRLESRSEVQWRDCTEIVATQKLDEPYLRHWAPVLGITDDLDELIGSP